LAAVQAEFNAKREELERDVAELEIGKRHVTEENESFRVKFNEEAARREDAVKNLKHRLALAEEDTKHFQVLVDETEKKLGTSQGELAAAWAELTALRDAVKSVGAQSTSSDSQLAELRGELARERQARVMAVESEQARTSVVEAHLDEQRHTYDAQMNAAERKADAAMKTAQKDRQLLAQARDERDVAERIAADLRVEKDGLERAGVDLREQLKFLRETVGHQKETIESLRLQTPQVIPRPPTMVAIGRVDGFTSPKVASLSGVVTAQKMDNDVDASAVEQVYVPPKTKGEVSPEMSAASTQAESPPPAFANATRPGPLLAGSSGRVVEGMGSPKMARGVEGVFSPAQRLQVTMPQHLRRANTVQQPPSFFGGMDGRVNMQVSGMRRVR
jgi:hypothetical protein